MYTSFAPNVRRVSETLWTSVPDSDGTLLMSKEIVIVFGSVEAGRTGRRVMQ